MGRIWVKEFVCGVCWGDVVGNKGEFESDWCIVKESERCEEEFEV